MRIQYSTNAKSDHDNRETDLGPTSRLSQAVQSDGNSPDIFVSRSTKASADVASRAIRTLDLRAPRYTSYPTADRFSENFGEKDFKRHLAVRDTSNLSVYVHIPFCQSLCYYCACNKKVTNHYERAPLYVRSVLNELELVDKYINGGRQLTQLHWGGGTPTYLKPPEIRTLMQGLRQHFEFTPDGEYSIEIDPRTVDEEGVELLAEVGFNRMSIGVQDFDPAVQNAVNRVQTAEQTHELIDQARIAGFQSTNMDLIYGLPLQSVESYARTIDTVLTMRPERIALYNYAHLPTRFRAQKLIPDALLPTAAEKMAIFEMASTQLNAAGYEYIGMDHFALPSDELAIAAKTGKLHRNFQGYSTQAECDLIALGSSAISRVGSCYSQNHRDIPDYNLRTDQGILPTLRGYELSGDDLIRRDLIMAIMCQGEVSKSSFENEFSIQFEQYFAHEIKALEALAEKGLVELHDDSISVSMVGRRTAVNSASTSIVLALA